MSGNVNKPLEAVESRKSTRSGCYLQFTCQWKTIFAFGVDHGMHPKYYFPCTSDKTRFVHYQNKVHNGSFYNKSLYVTLETLLKLFMKTSSSQRMVEGEKRLSLFTIVLTNPSVELAEETQK